MATVLRLKINDPSGINDLNESIMLDSANSSSFYNRGLGKVLMQENKEAIKDFEKAILLKSDFGEAFFSIGRAMAQLGNLEGACYYWKQSVERGYSRAQAIIDENCEISGKL